LALMLDIDFQDQMLLGVINNISQVVVEKTKRVFLLGPAHKSPVDGAALSESHEFETPIGSIRVDREITENLANKEHFTYYSLEEEENEHSLEMHLPYIRKTFKDITLVPIVVGSISLSKAQAIANELAEYFKDENNFFVISSDFCHYGLRFAFMRFDEEYCKERGFENPSINQYIECLDKEGIKLVESQSAEKFNDYLEATKNTICGRNPIKVFLETIAASGVETLTKNVRYNQSGIIDSKYATSVSYASFYTILQ
jgi:MEMO1 family protein